jgi:hypothetical protein
MFRGTFIRAGCCLAFLTGLGLHAASAGQPGKAGEGQRVKRIFQPLRFAVATDLADVLSKHFKGDAGVRVVADPSTNSLLISAPPTTVAEVVKLVGQLDRRPRRVAVELLVAEVPRRKAEGGKPAADKELDLNQFTGPAEAVFKKVEALKQKGILGELKRVRLTAVEGRQTSSLVGATKPYVSSIRQIAGIARKGQVMRTVLYRSVGVQVRVTAQVTAGNRLALDLRFDEARARAPEDGVPIGKDEDGRPVWATQFITAKVEARVELASGQAVAAQGVTTRSNSGQDQTLVIVTARLLEPEAGKAK